MHLVWTDGVEWGIKIVQNVWQISSECDCKIKLMTLDILQCVLMEWGGGRGGGQSEPRKHLNKTYVLKGNCHQTPIHWYELQYTYSLHIKLNSAEEIWNFRSRFYLAAPKFLLDSVWPFKCHWFLFICFLYVSKNKQRLFPYTTLTDWFV